MAPRSDGGQTGLPIGYLASSLLSFRGRGENMEVLCLLHHKFPFSLLFSPLMMPISRDDTLGILGLAGSIFGSDL